MEWSKIVKKAEMARDKIGSAVSVTVESWCHVSEYRKSISCSTVYIYYSEPSGHKKFDTVQDLCRHLNLILNPVGDEGVTVGSDPEIDMADLSIAADAFNTMKKTGLA
jgi:hypothetical protein